MKFLILYHSGAGNTRMVAKKIEEQLKLQHVVDTYSVESMLDITHYEEYDGIVIGFPTIHTHPTKRILDYMKSVQPLEKAIPVYLYTTCGMYSANTVRIFAKECISKNMIPIINKSYRCSATDGMLLAPNIKLFRKPEKNLEGKINRDCIEFVHKIQVENYEVCIPRFKLYSILNYPNKVAGHYITFPIYLHNNKCIKCGICIENCPTKAMTKDKNGYPYFEKQKCDKCYRCIHHCPRKALSLSKRTTPKITWEL
jgi:ferredoxin/flavodoxin